MQYVFEGSNERLSSKKLRAMQVYVRIAFFTRGITNASNETWIHFPLLSKRNGKKCDHSTIQGWIQPSFLPGGGDCWRKPRNHQQGKARQAEAVAGRKKARRPSYIYGWLEKIIIFLSAYNFLFGKNSSAGKKRELVTQDDIFLLHPTLFYHFPLFVLVLSSKFVVFRFFVWQKQPELTSFLFSFLCEKRMRQEMFGSRKKRRKKNELEQLYIKINIHLKPSEKRTPSNERTNELRLLFSHLAPHRKTNRKQTSKREEAKR